MLDLKVTRIPSVSCEIWEQISKGNEKFILYGYGSRGREIEPWLSYFNVDLIEIWDKEADKYDDAGEMTVPIKEPHDAFEPKDDFIIIITIEAEKQALIIKRNLRQMGYSNFISCESIFGAIKYAKYRKFLPFLLSDIM